MSAQTIERLGERARLTNWQGDDLVAHLSPAAVGPLSEEFVNSCVGWLRDRGYQSVVTSALPRHECAGFFGAGFDVHEELELLSHDLQDVPEVTHHLRRAWKHDQPEVVAVDALAFEPFWQLHDDGMEEALAVTRRVRFRVHAAEGGQIDGYVIGGLGASDGYVQRLAVLPAARRQGLGRAMVGDILGWMRRHRAARALVNTQRTNESALALYQACGFCLQSDGLRVLARGL